ncbi:MAG: orotidine-5'-phosphate decarboxylase [Mycoplasmoidaceae bacterium]
MGKDVIIACDFPTKDEALNFLDKFIKEKPFVKIGMELFYSAGPSFLREIKRRGHKIFLDLKLYDIPNTIRRCSKVLSYQYVDMFSIHASGTRAMMKAAMEGATREDGSKPLVIAITQLTSTDQTSMERDILIHEPIDKVVMHYAEIAKESGLSGVVCSALEANKVHGVCGKKFVTVTPGIRFNMDNKGDQKRVMTPKQAKKAGSDYIVVGRPITQAKDPVAVYKRCVRDFVG